MNRPLSSMRELARLLVAGDVASRPGGGADAVNRNLRTSLIRFAGAGGFVSLLQRSVSLAGAQVPALRAARVTADGRLEGVAQSGPAWDEAVIVVTACMLELLVTFIGDPLTRQLVREACPETLPHE